MELDFSMPLSQLNTETSEAVAIVGMSLQVGAAASEEEFWQMLCRGEDMICDFPEERKAEVAPFRERLYGKAAYVPRAYLPQISQFDAEYFRLTPLEAQMMNPEQRLFLESAYSCLQNAGYESRIRGSRTGVYVGYSNPSMSYEQLIEMGMGDTDYAAGVKISGNVESMIAARVSYLLDLQGPAMLVNTACSSSLSALHLACNAIKSGEIDAALVGAVKLYLVPGTVGNSGIQIASATGRTKTFDAQADGTGGGEGVITLMLKPLSLALADGDSIRAVIRGSRLNQDGASMGITAPNPEAQARLLRECWRECGIEPEELSYLEAHGTGTKLGDPMELEAITKAFADYTAKRQFCAIGSVKSNVGHLDCAAGLVGVAKAVLMLEKGKIPPTLHFQTPNSQIDFIHSPVYVCDKLEDWNPPQGRKCGVSAFGISGTNGHVVLEEAPKQEAQFTNEAQLLLISGQTEACLLENWRRLRSYAQAQQPNVRELCYSAAVGRAHRPWRAAIVLGSLEQFLCTEPSMTPQPGCYIGHCKTSATCQAVHGDLHALAQGYVQGENYPWEELYGSCQCLSLPAYAFDRKRYWVEHNALEEPKQKLAPCIDEHIALSDGSSLFRYRLSTAQCWELREHTLEGTHILPGTVYIEMMLEAGSCLFEDGAFVLQDVMFLSSYACKTEDIAELQITAKPRAEGFALQISSRKQGEKAWESHAEGLLLPGRESRPQRIDISELLAQKGEAQIIERQNNGPIKISQRWLSLDQLWKTDETMTAHFSLQEQYRSNLQSYFAYPSLLDGAVNAANILHSGGFCLPFSYKKAAFFRQLPASFYSKAVAHPENRLQDKIFTYDVTLYTDSGDLIAQIEGYTLKKVEQLGDVLHENRYHQLQWVEKSLTDAVSPKKLLLLCSPEQKQLPLLVELSRQVQTLVWTWDGRWSQAALPDGIDHILFCLGYQQTEQEDASLYQSLYEFLKQYGSLPVGCGLTLLTAHAAPVQDEAVFATHTGILGMGKSLRLEWPRIRAIDADETLTARELLQELSQSDYCAAWRHGRRYVEKMLPYQPKEHTVSFANEGTYVITGGFGGMGSTFWNALHCECPCAHIALLQRSAHTQELPANVHPYTVDLADAEQVKACFAKMRAELPPIRGIIHTAGVAGGQFVATGSWDAFEKVLRPKVLGTWNLLHCTEDCALDFFVLCSSMSAVFGATGQSDYTAANAFMDGIAHTLRQQGKPAVSISWSGWKDVGMAVANGVDPQASPLAFLTREEGWQSLQTAIAAQKAQLLIGTVTGALTANTLDLSAYGQERKASEAPSAQQIRILGKGGTPLTRTERRVAEVWAQTLGLQEVQLHEPFFDAGGSSLLISYLFKKLDEVFPGVIDITGLFVHDTVANIAAYIDSRMSAEEEAPLEQIEQDVETLVGQFVSGSLSEDELESLLESL